MLPKFRIGGLVSGFLLAAQFAVASQGPSKFSYEGRVFDTYGAPSQQTVGFMVRIFDPNGTCLLREETFANVNLATSNGYFSVTVGAGTTTANDPGLPLLSIFSNSGTVTGGQSCSYTPAAGDTRKVRILVNDGSTLTAMTPDISLGTAPFAVSADTLQGFAPTSFLSVNNSTAALTQTNLETVFASASNVTALSSLIAGTSTLYMKNGSNGASLPGFSSNPGSPTAGQIWYDTTNNQIKYYNGSSVQALGAGSSGTVTSVATGTGLTGGPISTSGTISLAASGVSAGTYNSVTVDTYGRVTAGTLPTTLTGYGITDAVKNAGGATSLQAGTAAAKGAASSAGRIYFATDTGAMYFDTGAVWVTLGGMAQANGSQNGYLSNTDWLTFNGKLDSSLSSGNIYVGNASNVATSVAVSGDATLGNTGALTVVGIRGRSVSATAPATGQVLRWDGASTWVPMTLTIPDITSLSTTLGNKLDASNMPANCAANQTLTFSSPTGTWACSSISITGSAFGSQTQNLVLASPSGSSGNPTFRALAPTDIPSIDASKITTGSIAVAQGGTGSTTGSITGVGALTFAAGGSNQNVTLTPSGTGSTILNGKVGIGTTAPIAPLHYVTNSGNADAIITAEAGNAELLLTGPSGSSYPGVAMSHVGGALQFTKVTNGSPSSYPWISANGATGLYSFTAITGSSVELKMSLQRGNGLSPVTNGTPLARLAFDGQTGSGYSFSAAAVQGVAAETFSNTANGAHLLFHTTANGTTTPLERMRIDHAGNVGIGTTTPNNLLHVMGSASAPLGVSTQNTSPTNGSHAEFVARNNGSSSLNLGITATSNSESPLYGADMAYVVSSGIGGLNIASNNSTGAIRFMTGGGTPTERMHIDGPSGNIGIGTTTPGYALHVVGTAGLSSGTAWTNASDRRLKNIDGDYEYGLNEVLKLHTVRYHYKPGNALKLPSDHAMTGFIAQEVMKVIPDAVHQRSDGYYELNVDPIHWATVNAIKELHGMCQANDAKAEAKAEALERRLANVEAKSDEIEQLKAENAELKARLERIEKLLAK